MSFANKLVKKVNSTPPVCVFQRCGEDRVDIPHQTVCADSAEADKQNIQNSQDCVSYFGDSK